MARYLSRPDILMKLEQRGFSQISIDKLRDCINYPTGKGNKEYMRNMLLAI